MSELLGQQELIAPDPRRAIAVPRGQTAWWGVDPSTKRVAIAWVTADGSRGVEQVAFPRFTSHEDAPRCAAIFSAVRELALEVEVNASPGLVLVEQPSGATPRPELGYAVGATLAALSLTVFGQIETCTSSWWKKRACGRGNIYKPKPSGPEYGVLTWARLNGYAGTDWDEADAWGIAEAARREVQLQEVG